MQAPNTLPAEQPVLQLPVLLVAEVQDALLVVVHDLARLDGLVAHATDHLMGRLTTALRGLADPALADLSALDEVRNALQAAVTDLQCQDLAAQLVGHASKVLQGCAYRIASESMGEEDGEAVPFVDEVPACPNPVTQAEKDAGSIELF